MNPSNPQKPNLGRRQDELFGPTSYHPAPTSNHHQDPSSHPRRVPQQSPISNPSRGNAGPYPPQSMRHPTPVIVELPDEIEEIIRQEPGTMVRPGNSQYPQQNQPSRFNHGAYAAGRNVPEGLRGPPGAPQQGSRQARPQSMSAHYQGQSPQRGQRQEGSNVSHEEEIQQVYRQQKNGGEGRPQQAQAQSGRSATHSGGFTMPGHSHPTTSTAPPPPLDAAAARAQALQRVASTQQSGRQTSSAQGKIDPNLQDRKNDKNPTNQARTTNKSTLNLDVTTFDGSDGTAVVIPVKNTSVRKEMTSKEKPGPPKPVVLFNSAEHMNTPVTITSSIDSKVIYGGRLAVANTAEKERKAAVDEEKKHLQWNIVSDAFANQQQGLEGAMAKYNELIGRFNELADRKNNNLQAKEELTDKFRRSGATLSTQTGIVFGLGNRGLIGSVERSCKCNECLKNQVRPLKGYDARKEQEEDEDEEREEMEVKDERGEVGLLVELMENRDRELEDIYEVDDSL